MVKPDIYYLVVSGGTMSGLGKGLTMSNIGIIIKCLGWNVTAIKIDPYFNVDAGTMSPFEHGEVFVLGDGGEVDLDLGNYERLLDIALTRDHNITSGKIFRSVIERERKGEYLGKTVQLVPHITDAVQDWISRVAYKSSKINAPNICLVEIGGTVGDIESSMYFEAIQQFSANMKPKHFCMCHVAFVPLLGAEGPFEFKTKPCQHSTRTLRQAGLNPDFIFCRSEKVLDRQTRHKISFACCLDQNCVISVPNVKQLYEMPGILKSQHFDELLCEKFGLRPIIPIPSTAGGILYTFESWKELAENAESQTEGVCIGIVAKYVSTTDTYRSVVEALKHAANASRVHLDITWIDAENLEASLLNCPSQLIPDGVHGILCPGGFGRRGTEGKIHAAKFCREQRMPFLGICLGMQIAVIEFARNVLMMPEADSEEFSKTANPSVVVFMPEIDSEYMGGTMCLGSRDTFIHDPKSLAYKIYDSQEVIRERHRHRYEVNPELVALFEENGFKFTGRDERGRRMEIAELESHPFFFCTQFHPEFTSRPTRPNPCFFSFVQAAKKFASTSKN